MESLHLTFGVPFFLLPSIFLSLLSFPKNPISHDVPEAESCQFSNFYLQPCFQLNVALGPTCSCFWWFRWSVELSSNTVFQMKQLLFHISIYFTVHLLHLCIVIVNMKVWMILALVSKDVSSLLVIFPNSYWIFMWRLSETVHINSASAC